jgi:hypothetical protein
MTSEARAEPRQERSRLTTLVRKVEDLPRGLRAGTRLRFELARDGFFPDFLELVERAQNRPGAVGEPDLVQQAR